jgi:hypothetical protein
MTESPATETRTPAAPREGLCLLESLRDGCLDAAGVLADWLQERGDPRAARLRRQWRMALLDRRAIWGRTVFREVCPRTWARVRARALFDYAVRLLSAPPGVPARRAQFPRLGVIPPGLVWPE